MNVLEALISVMTMQLATTLKGVTPALATLDTQAVDFLVRVSSLKYSNSITHTHHAKLYLYDEYT